MRDTPPPLQAGQRSGHDSVPGAGLRSQRVRHDSVPGIGPGAARPELGQERWPARLADFLAAAARVIEGYELAGLETQQAHRLAADIVLAIADDCGGFAFYLPHGQRVRLALRDQRIILADQQGIGLGGIAAEYGMSKSAVQRVIAAERRRVQALRPRAPTQEELQHRGRGKVRLPWAMPIKENQATLDI